MLRLAVFLKDFLTSYYCKILPMCGIQQPIDDNLAA